jgi:hypothetical protein
MIDNANNVLLDNLKHHESELGILRYKLSQLELHEHIEVCIFNR